MEQEHEEILRLIHESENETREIAFGSDHFVYIKYIEDGKTEGWKYAGTWNNLDYLESKAFECYNSGWIVCWNGKFKPKNWSGDKE